MKIIRRTKHQYLLKKDDVYIPFSKLNEKFFMRVMSGEISTIFYTISEKEFIAQYENKLLCLCTVTKFRT